MVKTVYVRDDDEPLWDRLAAAAEAEHRSVSYMLARAIEAFLSEARTP
jgi:predicted transcriptional regulator